MKATVISVGKAYMSVFVFSLLLASSSALLASMTNGNGEYDIASISNHVLLLEQMVSGLTTKLSEQANSPASATSELQVIKTKYTALQSSLDTERKLREEMNQNLTASIALLNTEVKYEVVLKQDITDQKDREILKFDGVKYNDGGGYHNTSGIFVAPTSGSYLFWCYVMNEDNAGIYINLHNEGSVAAKGHTPVIYGVASITTVLYVHKGDNVWFSKDAGSSKIDGEEFSSFGGALLHAY